MLKSCCIGFALLLISGCASFAVVDNAPLHQSGPTKSYSIRDWEEGGRSGDIALLLAFSGGGTRAAAFSYGVLEELRDTSVRIDGRRKRLLDEVDRVSAVSGGSFTAAYYGLYGDRIFDDFENAFLRHDVEGQLLRELLNPARWFDKKGRTEMAVEYYEKALFRGATFADMIQQDRPLILINATDLGHGIRFSFTQEYFNLLCSDLSSFPVARAVTASSAVPLVFNPVVVQNYPGCDPTIPEWLSEARKRAEDDPETALLVQGLESYFDKDRRKYAHLVDGGITDNLGLRAFVDLVDVVGGPREFVRKIKRHPPRRFVIISVDAATNLEPLMDLSTDPPSLKETIMAVTDVQLRRYNTSTRDVVQHELADWAQQVSTPDRPVTPYFIELSFADSPDPEALRFFNQVPTSFSLSHQQVDRLINAGHELLRNHAEFRRLIRDLGGRL